MAVNEIKGIVVGEFGKDIQLTLQDEDGSVQDISVYDLEKTVYCKPPMGSKLVSSTCAFVTDGTDGKLKFTWASGDVDRPGDWAGTVVMNKTDVIAKSYKFTMVVEEAVY